MDYPHLTWMLNRPVERDQSYPSPECRISLDNGGLVIAIDPKLVCRAGLTLAARGLVRTMNDPGTAENK